MRQSEWLFCEKKKHSLTINQDNKKHLKNVGTIRNCEPFYIAIHQVSLLSHAACASMSTTTTTRDRGYRYGPIEWAQSRCTK